MPPRAVGAYTLREGLIILGVGEGLGLAIVPSEAPEDSQVVG
jgi:hypothetical protein